MTAKRAKLSLDPGQHSKPPPSHGFDAPAQAPEQPPGDVDTGAAAAAVSAGDAAGDAAGRAAGRWRAHRPQGADAPVSKGGERPVQEPTTGGPETLLARAAALSRHPAVRVVAAGVLTGLSIYLLRRRLF